MAGNCGTGFQNHRLNLVWLGQFGILGIFCRRTLAVIPTGPAICGRADGLVEHGFLSGRTFDCRLCRKRIHGWLLFDGDCLVSFFCGSHDAQRSNSMVAASGVFRMFGCHLQDAVLHDCGTLQCFHVGGKQCLVMATLVHVDWRRGFVCNRFYRLDKLL